MPIVSQVLDAGVTWESSLTIRSIAETKKIKASAENRYLGRNKVNVDTTQVKKYHTQSSPGDR